MYYSPDGIGDAGFQELGVHFRAMWKELEQNREKWGCEHVMASNSRLNRYPLNLLVLGKTATFGGLTPDVKHTVLTLSYWKDLDSLNAFAQGPLHKAGWAWWNKSTKTLPHLGIMHEVYAAPKGNWENIYVNFRPFGMGK